jgi:hypothetical protein
MVLKWELTCAVWEGSRDLLPLTFDFIPLGQDLLTQALRKITLDLAYFLVKGEVYRG